MLLERKISQLKELPELQPDKKWKATTKFEVLGEISSQNRLMKATRLSATEKADLFMMKALRRLVPSATKVIAGFLIIFLGTGLGFVAQASVPGEPLWPIKRTIEQAELTFTLSSVRETEVHVKHVNERINEISKILQDKNSNSKPETEKAIKKAVVHLEKDVKAVDTSLKVVKEDKKPIEVVELAKKVKQATDATKNKVETIKSTSADSGSLVISEALEDVEKLTNETESTVLNIAVQVHDQVTINQTNTTTPDLTATSSSNIPDKDQKDADAVKAVITEMIATEIEQLTNRIATTKDKVEAVSVVQTGGTLASTSTGTSTGTSTAAIQIVKQELNQASVALTEAKTLLQEGAIKQAVDKVVQSQTVNTSAQQSIKQFTAQTAPVAEKPAPTKSTTTPSSTQIIGSPINMQNVTTTDELSEQLMDGEIRMKLELWLDEIEE